MKSFNNRLSSVLIIALLSFHVLQGWAQQKILAFPEAEGFGRYATGGRTGTVYHGASRTPKITVAVNGTDKATWQFPTNDAGVYRSSNVAGRYATQTCTFPASLLKIGENRLTLTYDGKDGCGVMWDFLKLEAGAVVTSNIADTEIRNNGATEKVYKYLQNGRLVIRKNGMHYNAQGQPLK